MAKISFHILNFINFNIAILGGFNPENNIFHKYFGLYSDIFTTLSYSGGSFVTENHVQSTPFICEMKTNKKIRYIFSVHSLFFKLDHQQL